MGRYRNIGVVDPDAAEVVDGETLAEGETVMENAESVPAETGDVSEGTEVLETPEAEPTA